MGCCSGPDDVYQTLRGLRTMGVRLERHQESALALARWLERQPGVARVLHPGLESHPGPCDLEARLFRRPAASSRSCSPAAARTQAHAFLDALRVFGLGYSWGGFESLAVHVNISDRTIAKGPYEGPVLRLQIGIEDVEDLKADLERGLAAAAKYSPEML